MGFDVSPFQKLVDQNDDLANVVQTCLTPRGGLLVLGQDAARDRPFYRGELQYTPITLEAWYTVNATQLRVAGPPPGSRPPREQPSRSRAATRGCLSEGGGRPEAGQTPRGAQGTLSAGHFSCGSGLL